MGDVRGTFLRAAAVARETIARPEVGEIWEGPSSLPMLSVRGLAGHLARAVFTVREYLDRAPPTAVSPVSAARYYAPLETGDIFTPFHQAVRSRGEEQAAVGQQRLVVELDKVLASLERSLADEPEDRMLSVMRGTPILLDEYLLTRIIELTVHIDDLAVSAGIDVSLPVEALDLAIGTLIAVARARHGDLAVLRALARRERDATHALRVL